MAGLLWKSPAIPDQVANNETLLWEIRTKVQLLASEDDPSRSDLAVLFSRYNASASSERDSIDAAFVWMTGYTFAKICAMVVTPDEKDYERTLEEWRKAGS